MRKIEVRIKEEGKGDFGFRVNTHLSDFEIVNMLQKSKITSMPNWKGFADTLINISFDGGDIDGGDLQEIAKQYGVLKEVDAFEPCGENCRCAEYGQFPQVCIRKAY